MTRYESAKEIYASIGIDTEAAMEALANLNISIHCWQGDDVGGFEGAGGASGGIASTGNYPGKARTPKELMADLDEALRHIPGTHRLNLHASYAITDEKVDRDQLEPRHFEAWVEYAKERGLGLDFNPTLFSHPMAADNLTLSHRTKKCAGSGSTTASPAVKSPSILAGSWVPPACAISGFLTATRMCPLTGWVPAAA